VPRLGQAVWQAFIELCARRRSGMDAQPFALVDVQAWCQLYRVPLTGWELDTLLLMDSAYLSTVQRNRAATKQAQQP